MRQYDNQDDALGMVIVVTINGDERFVFTLNRIRMRSLWASPGSRIYSTDKGEDDSSNETVMAHNAARRALKEKVGITDAQIQFVRKEERTYGGPVYIYAALASFEELALTSNDREKRTVKDFSFSETKELAMSYVHRNAYETVIRWIME